MTNVPKAHEAWAIFTKQGDMLFSTIAGNEATAWLLWERSFKGEYREDYKCIPVTITGKDQQERSSVVEQPELEGASDRSKLIPVGLVAGSIPAVPFPTSPDAEADQEQADAVLHAHTDICELFARNSGDYDPLPGEVDAINDGLTRILGEVAIALRSAPGFRRGIEAAKAACEKVAGDPGQHDYSGIVHRDACWECIAAIDALANAERGERG